MYHSITFGEKNTWDDWKLIPTSRPLFSPPSAKMKLIEIPGKNGALDISTTLTGRPIYNMRSGSFEFIVSDQSRSWLSIYEDILDYLHGKTLRAILEDDPDYFYEGLFAVNQWSSNQTFSTITINYNVGPYKKHLVSSSEDWLWDPFDFENGYIMYYVDMVVDGEASLTLLIPGGPQKSVPKITTSAAMSVAYKTKSYQLVKGLNYVPEMILDEGMNILIFSGSGIVTVDYRGGSL